MLRVGSGEFGDVFRAKWHGSFVAAKLLKRSDEIALGDFRTEVRRGRSLGRAMGCCFQGSSLVGACIGRGWSQQQQGQ